MTSTVAVVVALILAVLTLVAIIIDRRALLVSALTYVGVVIGYALAGTLRTDRVDDSVVFFATLVVLGALVLTLGVGWQPIRRRLVALLPPALAGRLPPVVAVRRAETARCAEASERLSGEIVESLTAGLLVVGLNREVRIINPAGRRMLWIAESVSPDDHRRMLDEPALSEVIDECLLKKVPISRRAVRLPEARHGTTHLGVTVSPLFDNNGDLHGVICLFTDLSAVKNLEEQLRLKESLATVGELTAGIAHEFRNGLATIHGYSKLVDLNALPPNYRSYVEGIRAEAESLSQVVTNFLNFARPAQLTLTDVDLGAVSERAAEEIRSDARALGGDVEVRGEFGVIRDDAEILRCFRFNDLTFLTHLTRSSPSVSAFRENPSHEKAT
jgi:signal transduction histidine kinase